MMDWRRIVLTVYLWGSAFLIACGINTHALAEIVRQFPSPNPSDSVSDLNGDGRRDFEIGKLIHFPIPGQLDFFDFYIANVRNGVTGARPSNSILLKGQSLLPLEPNTTIGPSPTSDHVWLDDFVSKNISFNAGEGWTGPWAQAKVALLGVRFEATDGIHFGWLRVRVENWIEHTKTETGIPVQTIRGPEVIEWAYESAPNTPIVAGAVPEPASVVLGLIGLAGAVALRRRLSRVAQKRGIRTTDNIDDTDLAITSISGISVIRGSSL